MIERILDWLYDFNPTPNARAWEQAEYTPWTYEEKMQKFKRDMEGLRWWR